MEFGGDEGVVGALLVVFEHPPAHRLVDVLQGAEEVLANRHTLNDTERAGGVLRHLIVEGDLSAHGLVNAVTHLSQDVEEHDPATEFEALGGNLIELPPGDWNEVAPTARETPQYCRWRCFGTPAPD